MRGVRAYIARQAGDVARADVGGLAGSGEASVDVGRLRVGGHRVEEGEGGGASDDGEGHGDCANACEMVEVGGSVPNAGRKVEEMSCFSGWQAPGFAYGRIFLLRLDRGPALCVWDLQERIWGGCWIRHDV